MNSQTANLFLSIQEHISGLTDPNSETYFKHVDQDLGQMEMPNAQGRYPVSWPCVLIDVDDETYTDLSSNVQQGVFKINFRLGFPPFSPSSASTPQLYKEKAIYFYDLELVLYRALHGWCPGSQEGYEDLGNYFGVLKRRRAITERREDFLRVRQLSYEVGVEDYSAKTPFSAVLVKNVNIIYGREHDDEFGEEYA